MRSSILLVLVGCGPATKPPPSHQATGPALCLPKPFHSAAVSQLKAQGDRAVVCFQATEERDGMWSAVGYEAKDHKCFVVDGRGAIIGETAWTEPASPEDRTPANTIEWDSGTSYKVCKAGKCTTLTARHVPGDVSGAAILSDDGTRAFVLSVRSGKNGDPEIWGELIDAVNARSISEVKITQDDGSFGDTSTTRPTDIYGDKVAIGIFHAGPCCGTSLFDTRDGKHVGLHDWNGRHMKIDATTLATSSGHGLSLIDLRTMRTVKELVIPGKQFGEGLELTSSEMLPMPGGAVVAHAQPAGVMWFDAKSRTFTSKREIPLCGGP